MPTARSCLPARLRRAMLSNGGREEARSVSPFASFRELGPGRERHGDVTGQTVLRKIALAAAALAGAGAAFALVSARRPFFLRPRAEGVLAHIAMVNASTPAAAPFTLDRPLVSFRIYILVRGDAPPYSLDIRGPDAVRASLNMRGSLNCGLGRNLPPGRYTATLTPLRGPATIEVFVADRHLGMTGWQLLAGAHLAAGAGVILWLLAARASGSEQQARAAAVLCRLLWVPAICLFFYLLLHEGGHALAALAFGRFSWAGSDFWGIGGSPHAGLRTVAAIPPWQRAVISISGPLLPLFAGWLGAAWWFSAGGRRRRDCVPFLDLLASSMLFLFLVTSVVLPGYVLGLISDGDWRGFIENVPFPHGFAYAAVMSVFAISAVILVRISPQVRNCWRRPYMHANAGLPKNRLEKSGLHESPQL